MVRSLVDVCWVMQMIVARFLMACVGGAAFLFSPIAATHAADTKFIRLIAPLDEPRGLCLDIPGHRDRVDVKRPLVLYRCKRGIWNLDERFDYAAFRAGRLLIPEYGLCVRPAQGVDGGKVMLGACDDAVASWRFEDSRLQPAAHPRLCLSAGPGPSELTPGGRRLPSRHVARGLFLAPCEKGLDERQKWRLSDSE